MNSFRSESRDQSTTLAERLGKLHGVIRSRYPFVERLALALYDPSSDLLKTFVSSNTDGSELARHAAKLSDVPSLKYLADHHTCRVVDSLQDTYKGPSTHSGWLLDHGYESSYTVPVFQNKVLAAFLFFDAREPGAFGGEVRAFLDVFAELVAQLYLLERRVALSLMGAVHVASGLALIRDTETGQHLNRIAAYARLIGQGLSESHGLNDEFVEYLHLFAPLHDIGKVGIPDKVLLKPGRLDDAEWSIMKQHVQIGEQLVDQMVDELGMEESLSTRMMRNIVAAHHERGDGSGYPRGLLMQAIPLEARIVSVADVFDALTNRRPYKPAWTPEQVEAELRSQVALNKLDSDCVRVILDAKSSTSEIQALFVD